MSFYNTITEKEHLDKYIERAETQDAKVLGILKGAAPKFIMTPSQVHKVFMFLYNGAPLTSIRRSLSTLSKKGLVQKMEEKRKGIYGVNEHYYKWLGKEK